MARKRCALLVVAWLALGCATDIHRSSCRCELVLAENVCRMEHEEHSFKRRPFWESIGNAIRSAVGGIF